jgi:hypothetical protein
LKRVKWRDRYDQVAWRRVKTKADELLKLDLFQGAIAEFVALDQNKLLTNDEAQTLVKANRALQILTASSANYLSEIGNSELRALCDALDERATRLSRSKGVAPGNQARADEASARKRICRTFCEEKRSRKKNPPSKSQIYRDLRNQWLTLRGKTDLELPAKSTFMGYVADL